jgi:hypothetical protein
MRYHEIMTEAVRKEPVIQAVEWPTNMAWRVKLKRYRNVDVFDDNRRGKLFAIPFRNWTGTYYSLLGKDIKRLPYMPTEIIEIPDSAMVGDMSDADDIMHMKAGPTKDALIDLYPDTLVSYARFKRNPKMFGRPEIMVEPSMVKVLPLRLAITDEIGDGDEPYLLGVKPI